MSRRTAMGTPKGAPTAVEGVRLSIVHVAECPGVDRLRAEVEAALELLGARADIEEIEDACLSPTLLIDGAAIGGHRVGDGPACRTDLPTRDQIVSAFLVARDDASSRRGVR